MREIDVYLPATYNDGTSIPAGDIERIKDELARAFGGYTHLRNRIDGTWSMGGVSFHDEITIVRVLDDGRTNFDFVAFKRTVEAALKQEHVLIVERQVEVIQ